MSRCTTWTSLATLGALVATPIFASTASGQTQVRDSLNGYVDLGLRVQSANRFITPSRTNETNQLTVTTLPLYGELGLIDRWLMLTYQADLYRRNALDEQGATNGLGDMRVGLWSQLYEGPVRILAAAQFGLPTGDPYPEGVDDDTDVVALVLPTGDGEFDVELNLAVARELEFQGYPLRHYVNARFGYWIRTTPRAPQDGTFAAEFLELNEQTGGGLRKIGDSVTYWFEAGTQIKHGFWERLWFTATLSGVESFTSDAELDGPGGAIGVGLGDGVTYTSLGGQVSLALPAGLGLGARVEGPLRGRLILDAPTFRFYGSFQF